MGTGLPKNSGDKYSRKDILARYVEAQWGDLINPVDSTSVETGAYAPGARTIAFYDGVMDLLIKSDIAPSRILDVGTALGRVVWELSDRYPEAESIVGCEISPEFYSLARALLFEPLTIDFVPIPGSPAQAFRAIPVTGNVRAMLSTPEAVERVKRIRLFHENALSLCYPEEYFDLILCLNVIDRVTDPKIMLSSLARLLSGNGYLCLASPHDWQDSPADPIHWIDDLKELFDEESWRVVEERNLEYVFRTSDRRIVSYVSQVILAKRLDGSSSTGKGTTGSDS